MGMFDDLKDVKVRDEVKQEKSDLEKVLDAEAEIIKKYEQDGRFKQNSGKENEAYQSLYKLTQEKLADTKITSGLLQSYIDARDNTEKNTTALIRGMYSSTLLEIISTTQPEITTFIDGKNKTFNYLFYYIHHVKNLTLTNIKGDETLYNAGSQKGSAQNITLSRIEGKETLKYSGSDKGIAKQILQEKELTEKQKNLLSRIETIVETIHTLSFEQQRVAHDEIARLQIEIFAGET